MKKSCVYIPKKGEQTFLKLKEKYGYNKAVNIYLKAVHPNFLRDFKTSLILDDDGVPTFDSIIKNKYMKKFIGTIDILKTYNDEYKEMENTIDNYKVLLQTAKAFNQNPDNSEFAAYVDDSNPDTLKVKVVLKSKDIVNKFNNQYSTMTLNDSLIRILRPTGLTIGMLSNAEVEAGRTGVTNFDAAKGIARDLTSIIRVANNKEGYESIGEETAHLLIGMNMSNPLVTRSLDALSHNENALRTILGDQYDDTMEFQKNDLDRVAFEALGKLLQQNLLKQTVAEGTPYKSLIQRLIDKIKSIFRSISDEDVLKAINDADVAMGEMAKSILNESIKVDEKALDSIITSGQFNNLSDKIQRNIKILEAAQEAEIKRFAVLHSSTKRETEFILKNLKNFSKESADTYLGICYYANNTLKDLRGLNEQFALTALDSIETRFTFYRKVQDYINSYMPFITSLNQAISQEEKEVTEQQLGLSDNEETAENLFLKEKELEGEGVFTIKDMLTELNHLTKALKENFNTYALPDFTKFISKFSGFEGSITIPYGKLKGQTITVESLLKQANGDISFFDLWLDPMSTSGDLILQMFDSAVKDAKDKARVDTIDIVNSIKKLMKECDTAGITSFDWMFERTDDGSKSHNYISPVNQAQFTKDSAAFEKYLNEKYGKNPSGDTAKEKKKERSEWRLEHAIWDEGKWIANPETYKNEDYYNLSDTQKDILKRFLEIKAISDRKLYAENVYNTKAIQIRKGGVQRLLDSTSASSLYENIKGQVNDALFLNPDDDQTFGARGLRGFNGEEYMTVPILYINELENPNELSTDVFSTLMLYTYMANNFEQVSKVVDPLEVGKILIKNTRNLGETRGDLPLVEKYKGFGKEITNRIYKINDSNIQRKLDDFFESKVYQRHLKDGGVFEVFGKQASANKLVALLLKGSSMAQLGFNWLANSANVTTGVCMQNIEAAACQYFKPKELFEADKEYTKMFPAFIEELGSRYKTNELALFDEMLDLKQDYKGRLRGQKKSVLERVFGENIAFIGQDAGDHWLYNRTAIAMCKHMKIQIPNGDGTYRVSSVWDAKQIVDAGVGDESLKKMVLPEGIKDMKGRPTSASKIGRQILFVNQHLFGIYNEDDEIAANRVIIGKLLIQYKKWMKPQYNKRFMKGNYNITMEEMEEGYYRTLARVINELIRGKYQLGSLKEQLKDEEKANINRALMELIQCFAVFGLANWIKWDDDKHRPWAQKFAEYSTQRLSHELGTLTPIVYVPGGEALPMLQEDLKTLKTPIASLSVVQNAANLVGSFLDPKDWNDELQSGPYEGHSTLYKNFMKAPIPGIAQYKMIDRFLDDLDTSIEYYVRNY